MREVFGGRHPRITYLLGPVPLLVAMWLLYLASALIPMYCIGTFIERMGVVDAVGSLRRHLRITLLHKRLR